MKPSANFRMKGAVELFRSLHELHAGKVAPCIRQRVIFQSSDLEGALCEVMLSSLTVIERHHHVVVSGEHKGAPREVGIFFLVDRVSSAEIQSTVILINASGIVGQLHQPNKSAWAASLD